MKSNILKVHPNDNIIAALQDLKAGERIASNGQSTKLLEDIPTKHKFAAYDFAEGDEIIMYGVLIGKATRPIPAGTRISRENVVHDSEEYRVGQRRTDWKRPDVSKFNNRTFNGFHRLDGNVGTRNY